MITRRKHMLKFIQINVYIIISIFLVLQFKIIENLKLIYGY